MITTIVGGTVGGYITYAGAHKLLDSGVSGVEHQREITRSAFTGIAVTGVMRYVLFLAFLGVTASGVTLDLAGNPAAQAFEAAAGELGMRAFGLVLWAAGISSVIGAAFTSVSFLSVFSRRHGAGGGGDRPRGRRRNRPERDRRSFLGHDQRLDCGGGKPRLRRRDRGDDRSDENGGSGESRHGRRSPPSGRGRRRGDAPPGHRPHRGRRRPLTGSAALPAFSEAAPRSRISPGDRRGLRKVRGGSGARGCRRLAAV